MAINLNCFRGRSSSQYLSSSSAKGILFSSSLFVVFCFSFFYPIGYSPDYFQYEYFIENTRGADLVDVLEYRFEPGFSLLVSFLTVFVYSNLLIFSLISVLSTALKLHVLTEKATLLGFSLAVVLFFFKVFPLQDANQIRAALSVSFLFLFYAELTYGSRVFRLFAYLFLSLISHYSAAMVLPFLFLFLLTNKRSVVFPLALLVFLSLKIFSPWLYDYLGGVLVVVSSYQSQSLNSVGGALFSPVLFPEFFIIFSSLYFWRQCSLNMQRIVLLEIFGFSVFYGMSDFNIFAVRGREMFSVFWLIFVAEYGSAGRSMRLVIWLFVVSSVFLGSYLFYFSNFFGFDKGLDF